MRATIILSTVLLLCSVPLQADQEVDRTVRASAAARIEIDNVAGSVSVMGWDRNEVHIVGTLGDDVEGLDVSGEGDRISIEVDVPDGRGRRWGRRDIECDLEIKVPVGASVEIDAVSASVEVENVNGDLELATVSGRVEADGSPSSVRAESVSGRVQVSGSRGPVDAESVSGSVRVEGASERVRVSTVSGSVRVISGQVERADFESVSGSVEFEGSLAPGARLDAGSHSGNVTLILPPGTSGDFDLSTFSGDFESDFEFTVSSGRFTPGKKMRFTTGDGDARITVETFSGNVRLRKQ